MGEGWSEPFSWKRVIWEGGGAAKVLILEGLVGLAAGLDGELLGFQALSLLSPSATRGCSLYQEHASFSPAPILKTLTPHTADFSLSSELCEKVCFFANPPFFSDQIQLPMGYIRACGGCLPFVDKMTQTRDYLPASLCPPRSVNSHKPGPRIVPALSSCSMN